MAKKLSEAAREALREKDWRRVDAMTSADIARQIAAHADAAPDINVRAIREAIGMTQVEIAAAYEFRVRTVQEWERGAKRPGAHAAPCDQGRSRRTSKGRWRPRRRSALLYRLPYLIGGAYCRPPLFHSAFKPRLILIGERCPTLRSKISP